MQSNTAPDGATHNHETWMSGIATAVSFCLVIVFAVVIAHESVDYVEAKIDSFLTGPAWLKKW